MVTKAQSKREIGRLVKKLDNLSGPEFKRYDEANTKKDFIEPLFRALGWAIDDRREVTAEDKVSRGRVDYAFRIEGIPKFLLEAKPLKADLDNPQYAWQAINYAWTKGVTWAVLTDFEGLKVYNAQWKGPSLLYNRFLDIPYTEYLERFDELWLLSRRSFEQGLLDIEAEKVAKKAKREAVGKELFDDLIVWRQRLYRQLRGWKENKKYSEAQIDEAVQRILDRLIFIRTAEDRELEERALLPAVREWRDNGRRKELDKALVRIFREFDKKYDSELFEGHFCEDLVCDSTTYASVIEGLYGMRDEVPTYNFDAIDVDVLGGIYEQYLSYGQGLPEEVEKAKRRRRKKRGIYYTPKFVVQYIVENTVGRLLQERSHDEIRKLRILDPACGSGSFLIEAFDRLDRYHQEARGTAQRSDEKAAQDDFLERLRILRDNIYGVDLDPQAVEIARLNLLLKALYQRALLPKLENNIRCGNSLISGMPIELSQYFGADWEAQRPFNWEEEFHKIMQEGGFDVVIGNPPYGMLQPHNTDEGTLNFLRDHYTTATFKLDMFQLFIERCVRLVKDGGYVGLIVPNTLITNIYSEKLRNFMTDTCKVIQLVVSSDRLFPEAEVNNIIVILQKESRAKRREDNLVGIVLDADESYLTNKTDLHGASIHELKQPDLGYLRRTSWNVKLSEKSMAVFKRLQQVCELLGSIAKINRGLITGDRDRYFSPKKKDDEWFPIITGTDVTRYQIEPPKEFVYFRKPPRAGGCWDEKVHLHTDKVVIRQIGTHPTGALDTHPYCVTGNIFTVIPFDQYQYNSKYLLGLLNSSFVKSLWHAAFRDYKSVFPELKGAYLQQLPIPSIDFENPKDVKMHDDVVALVERMLDLHKRLKDAKARGEEEKNLGRQIARTDRKIDNLVYRLYGLTEEEVAIVEGE